MGVSSQRMKGKRFRYPQTGEFHFLTFYYFRRRAYLSAVAAMERFEDALERVRRRYLFVVAGYAVMPEHAHLLVNEPKRAPLSKAIQALKLSVSMRSRERPFWQAHYYDFNVSTHAKFVEKLRYIHRNPVKRSLVAKPEDWRWSSFRHYQTGTRGTVEIESTWTARERGWQLTEWICQHLSRSPNAGDRGYHQMNITSFEIGSTRRNPQRSTCLLTTPTRLSNQPPGRRPVAPFTRRWGLGRRRGVGWPAGGGRWASAYRRTIPGHSAHHAGAGSEPGLRFRRLRQPFRD